MSDYTYEAAIREAIFSMPEGTVFAMDDLQDLTSYDSLRKVLSRVCTAGHIERITQGIYRFAPKGSEVAQTDAAEIDVANALARNNC